jgi:TonB family protein
MIASWMAYAAAVSALLTIAGVALERVAAARGRPRRIVWFAMLLGSLAWPAASTLRHLLPESATPLPLAITVLPVQVVVDNTGLDRATLINRGLIVAWAVASALLLFRLTRGMVRLRRTRDGWRRGVVDGTSVRLSGNVGPAVVGLRSMEVVLPEWIVSLDAPLRAIVLCHEEEHRQARDPYLLFAAAVAVLLMPWNLALWFQARRLRLAIELDCDARVLRAHPSAERYGLLMLTIAQRRSIAPALFAPMLSEPATQLERRITAMRTTTRRLARMTVIGGTTLAVAAIAFACSLQSENPVAPDPRPAPQFVSKGSTFFEFQVEHLASPIPGNPSPRYPDMLRSANVEGEVLAQFIVNADGAVDMGSFKVLKSTHDLFTASVRNALPQMRFDPATVGNQPVRQLMQMPFSFSLSKTGAAESKVGPALVGGSERRVTRQRPVVIPGPETGNTAAERRVQLTPQQVNENQTYFEFQVETTVSPLPGNMPPRYPDMLRSANVEGEVLAQFVVDQNGMPDMTTFKVLKSTHELFTQAVQLALPQMKFHAADVGGHAVKQLVQMPFQFSLTKN